MRGMTDTTYENVKYALKKVIGVDWTARSLGNDRIEVYTARRQNISRYAE